MTTYYFNCSTYPWRYMREQEKAIYICNRGKKQTQFMIYEIFATRLTKSIAKQTIKDEW